MTVETEPAGMAALSICEALLLSMVEQGLLSHHEIHGVLHDAAAAHKNALGTDDERTSHRAAAALIDRIVADGNALRKR